MQKRKKIILNFITDALPIIIIGFLGIFKMKLFLEVLGQETLGLYQLFIQVMTYIALVDGGLSSAVLYALYKPNTSNDQKKFNAILAGAYKIFKKIGAIVFLLAALVGFIIPYLIKENSFSNIYISITFLIFSLSNVINYFFVPYQVLLEVKEKKYISNIALQSGQILQSVTEIIMLLKGCSFTSILVMHSIVKLLANLVMAIMAKKMYPNIDLKSKKIDTSFKEQIKHLIFHKINGLVGSNIDVILISKFLGLKSVAIYSSYKYITNTLENIIGKIKSAVQAIIGNIISKSKEVTYQLFLDFHSLMFMIGTIICVPLSYALNSFIEIWYEGEIETSIYISLAFTLCLFVYIIKQPIVTFVNADGLFKETKKCALADTLINLFLSLFLMHFIGIPGVLIATAISVFIAEYILKNKVLHKELFKTNMKKIFINFFKLFTIAIIDFSMFYLIIKHMNITNIGIWLLFYTIFTIINGIIVFIIYHIIGETKIIEQLRRKHGKNINLSVKRK